MFSRKFLALSLSCILAPSAVHVAFAQETDALTALTVKKANTASSAVASDAVSTASTSGDDDASSVESAPTPSALDTTTTAPTAKTTKAKAVKATQDSAKTTTTSTTEKSTGRWSLDSINNAQWTSSLARGQFPIYAKAQVLLNRKHASPGAIDGSSGKNTLKAISAYQTMSNLPVTGELDQVTWDSLNANETSPAFVEYTITAADIKGPYAKSIPHDYALQAKMPGLYYTRVTEMLGEKFHIDEGFLQQLNPHADFNKVGQQIIVPSARNDLPEDIQLIVAIKPAKQLYLFNSHNKLIASFPATIGSSDTPSPTGSYTIRGVTHNPWYSYNPKNFLQGKNNKPLQLPPGPNGPVGSTWIGLSKPSFGIHGTPNPSAISKTASHGCIRLTNWDVGDLSKHVKPGVRVIFKD